MVTVWDVVLEKAQNVDCVKLPAILTTLPMNGANKSWISGDIPSNHPVISEFRLCDSS